MTAAGQEMGASREDEHHEKISVTRVKIEDLELERNEALSKGVSEYLFFVFV